MSEDWREQEPLDKAAGMAARGSRAAGQMKTIAQGIQSAYSAIGAAASGSTVGGAAAGSALGGPLGAAIGALVTSKTFWKTVLSVCMALLLFIYIIVNAVGIILAYLGFADADSYVAQARAAEYQNIKSRIETVLTEDTELADELYGLIAAERDALLEEIGADYEENWDEYDGYEIELDEYETILKPNLAQYLAVIIEEEWGGNQIVGFQGYGYSGGLDGELSSSYDEYFSLASATYQVPEALLKAMAKAESEFDPNAVSHAGAIGIMQLMPSTAANLGVTDPYDPKQNIMGGAKYLSQLLRAFSAYSNGLELAIAAYNAGPDAVKKAGYRIPQNGETPAYVEKVKGYLSFADGTGEDTETAGGALTGEGLSSENGMEVSAILLKSLVEERAAGFLGWEQTGTHTETEGSGEEEEEYEIVDYSIVVAISPELSETQTGYQYRTITDQASFQYALTLFELAGKGADNVGGLIFQAASWKNYILGEGASQDSYAGTISTEGDTIFYDNAAGCVEEVVYYNQGEEPWASLSYGGSTIGTSGCGPTALAIVISTLTGQRVTPEMIGKFAIDGGYYVKGAGTSHAFPAQAARNWGLSVERMKREQMNAVLKGLKEGKMAVVICAENTISKSGHFIVLTGVTEDGYIAIADPGSRSRTGNRYSPATIQSYARNLSDGSIWLIGE